MHSRIMTAGWILLLSPVGCGVGNSDPPGSLGPGLIPSATAQVPGAAAEAGGGAAAGSSSSGSAGTGSDASAGGSGGSGSSGGPIGSSSSGGIAGGSGSGGSGGSAADAAAPAIPPPRVTPDAFTGAPAFVSKTGSSPHNAGKSCMASGCHATGGGGGDAPPFLIGGTVYQDYAGTIPAPGVEVRVLDSKGNAVSVYSGTNGNFYVNAGSAVAFPAMVGARDATTTRPMVTALTGTMGSCASTGCHVVGGTPASGAYYPIHVP
jgi:hypothetical protein